MKYREYNSIMRKNFIIIYLVIFSLLPVAVTAQSSTDDMLYSAIEEFSLENYETALEIIDNILKLEPDNNLALLYKKSIEDVYLNNSNEELVIESQPLEVKEETQVLTKSADTVSEEKKYQDFDDLISLTSYLGSTPDKEMVFETGLKLILGLPIIEFKTRSNSIDYDINRFTLESFPLEKLMSMDTYNLDFGIGLRYIPFENRVKRAGFLDFKIGATNFSLEDIVVPYIGFDTELFLLSLIDDNSIFESLWIGGRGSIHYFNGDVVDNYSLEFKAGFRIGPFNIGGFYGLTNIDSLETAQYNQTVYGLMFGLNF